MIKLFPNPGLRYVSHSCRRAVVASAVASTFLFPYSAIAVQLPHSVFQLREAENWQAVLDVLNRLETNADRIDTSDSEMACFLRAAAMFHTEDPEARQVLEDFVSRYPASENYIPCVLMIGDCCFADKDYGEAMIWYGSAKPLNAPLPASQRSFYTYRLAVSRLMNGLADEETDKLLTTLSRDPQYAVSAHYYRAYYDYLNRDYDKAYSGFETVARELAASGTPRNGMEPQYYMIQIEYIRGEYDNVIKHGMTQLKKNRVEELLPELHRVMGLSHFKKGNYHSANGLLYAYVDAAARRGFSPSADAVYALGVCEYEEGDSDRATSRFSTLTEMQDIIGQGAWYHLGEIAMTEGRYDEAVLAFGKSLSMPYDSDTAELASYNRISAVTHGGTSPFGSTTEMYEEFLSNWPASKYADSVRRGLYQAYAASKDYDNALLVLDAIRNPSEEVKAERQKLLYAKGTRLQRAGKNKEAVSSLEKCVDIAEDAAITADAGVRLGQARYAAGDYKGSVKALDKAMSSARLSAKGRTEALYQRAYSNLRSERYRDAARDFKAVSTDKNATRDMISDARLRLADCLYYTGNLGDASQIYSEARETADEASDYATLRLALMTGLQGDRKKETSLLRDFLRDYPQSGLRDEALFRLGTSLEAQDNAMEALSAFRTLANDPEDSSYAPAAAYHAANLLLKSGNAEEAEENFRNIIARYPSSDEAKEADTFLRDLYAANGTLEEYAAYLASIKGAPKIEADSIEEITFRTAERAYVNDPTDVTLLRNYICKYPDGKYLAQALLRTATADAEAGHGLEALAAVDSLLEKRGNTPEAEDAALLKEDLKEFSDLESALEKADSAREGKKGREMLKKLASNPDSPVGARATVELGERLIKDGKNNEALKLLDAFTVSGTPQQYWLARGFLSLADVHHAMGKDWLAKEYIISLRDNYPGSESDIAEGITKRLNLFSGKSPVAGESSSKQSSSTHKSRKRK